MLVRESNDLDLEASGRCLEIESSGGRFGSRGDTLPCRLTNHAGDTRWLANPDRWRFVTVGCKLTTPAVF